MDPWREYQSFDQPQESDPKLYKMQQKEWDAMAVQVYREFWRMSVILRLPSLAASEIFANGKVDAVYLDAGHSEACVSADITTWLPKIRSGGIIGGHDYQGAWPGVVEAVREAFPGKHKQIDRTEWIHEVL